MFLPRLNGVVVQRSKNEVAEALEIGSDESISGAEG
jgi:hypothetical protein